jgi:adenylate cyclase
MSETRKLAAILVSDVVGFSRLAGADEERLLARLRALRSDLIDPTVAIHKGRVVKRTGDGAIVEFRSVVDAVRCAIEIQNAMVERNAGVPEDRRIVFRIGVHVGDVVEESDGDLMGDGVNIAARLEGVCAPGAICLSEAAYWQVKSRLELAVTDQGETKLKNIVEPIRTYSLSVGAPATSKTVAPAASKAADEKPSIAALPFQNMSGDAEQEYFVDGLVEDIITGLSRIKSLVVIARNSSFVYKGKAVDVRQVGRELGARYVLEGSVRKAGNRLRITVQVIETETGAHLWADRFDGALDDVFDLQDQITDKVVGVVEPSVQRSEIERARRKRPESLDAYDLCLRALPHMSHIEPKGAQIAAGFLEEALKLEPDYPLAHAILAWSRQVLFLQGGLDPANKTAALAHARSAIGTRVDDATALTFGAFVTGQLGGDHATALTAIGRALSLNPSCAAAHYIAGTLNVAVGNHAAAIMHADRALRLSPFDPLAWNTPLTHGAVAFAQGRYSDAATGYAKAVEMNPAAAILHYFTSAALALAGRIEEGKATAAEALQINPKLRVRMLFEAGLPRPIAEKVAEGMRLLDLPE